MDSGGLDSLPVEITSQIMEELLALHKTDGSITQLQMKSYIPRFAFCPDIHPQVLRVSKNMFAVGKSVLDRSNRWIVVDMDFAYLLTVWASAFLEMIVINPESAQDLPFGMMHIRVKPYTMASGVSHFWGQIWPKATAGRQIILFPASQLSKFISALRITELANVLRVAHGELFKNRYTNEEYHLKRGEHGLSILIHVNEGYPRVIVSSSLEEIRKLHGPLNEVSIVGAVDEKQARSIEASIPLPRDVASDSTFSEVVIHIMDLIALAEAKIQEGVAACAPKLYEQARAMVINTHNNDRTPWGGWITNTTAKELNFEMIVLCASSTNYMVHRMIGRTNWLFPTADKAIARHLSPDVQGLMQERSIRSQLPAYVYLLNGLHCVLSAKVGTSRKTDLSVVFHGLDLIMTSQLFTLRIPSQHKILFQAADKFSKYIWRVGPDYRHQPKIEAYIAVFAKWFSENLKPVKWRVHECHVPQRLRDKGALSKMQKESLLMNQELDKYLIVDTLVVEEGAEGEFYLL